MEEIKIRLNEIGRIATRFEKTQDNKSPRAFLEAEFAFLQLRYVCELVCLAALAAHKPMGLNSQLMKSWNVGKTFEKLFRMNPMCFPRSAKVTSKDRSHHLDHSEGTLKRRDLQRIWNSCGEILHRGVIRHAFDGAVKVYDIGQLDAWAGQIGAHLSTHTIMVLDKQFAFLVTLTGGEGGSVQIVTIATDGPSKHVPSPDQRSSESTDKPSS